MILTFSLPLMLPSNNNKRESKLFPTRGGKGVRPARLLSVERGTTSLVVDERETDKHSRHGQETDEQEADEQEADQVDARSDLTHQEAQAQAGLPLLKLNSVHPFTQA